METTEKEIKIIKRKIERIDIERGILRSALNFNVERLSESVKKENSKLEHQENLIERIEKMFKVCEDYSYSKDDVCNHFGVNSFGKIWDVEMLDWKYKKDRTLLVIELKQKWVEHNGVGVSKEAFDNILKSLKEKYGVYQSWNGREDHKSISIVIKRPIPESLRIALKNYSKDSGVLGCPEDTYSDKFDKNLKEVLRK